MSPTPTSTQTPRPRPKFTPRAAILAVILTAVLFYLVVPLRTYLDQRHHLTQLQQQTQLLEHRTTQLQSEVRQLGDSAYLERLARECLGMVRPGEIAFVVIPKGSQPSPPPC